MVPEEGFEPSRYMLPLDFESSASTDSATPAGLRAGNRISDRGAGFKRIRPGRGLKRGSEAQTGAGEERG